MDNFPCDIMMTFSDISVYDSSSHVGVLGSNVAKFMNSPFSIACATFPGIGGMPAQMYTKLFSFPKGPATGAIFSVNSSASETLSLGFSGNIRTDGVESSTSSVSRSPIVIYRKDGNSRANYALLKGLRYPRSVMSYQTTKFCPFIHWQHPNNARLAHLSFALRCLIGLNHDIMPNWYSLDKTLNAHSAFNNYLSQCNAHSAIDK